MAADRAAELLLIREALPVLRETCAEAAFTAGRLAGVVQTPLERELLLLWLATIKAEGSVLDLLAALAFS